MGREMLIVVILRSIHDSLHLIGRNLFFAIIGIQTIDLLLDIRPRQEEEKVVSQTFLLVRTSIVRVKHTAESTQGHKYVQT
jgi:hypothetical protein